MINRRILTAAVAAMMALSGVAQINSPQADGYIARGIKMYEDANYNGCIDQMLQVRQLAPDLTQSETALYYVAMATMGLGDDEALPLLSSFLARYPQSGHRQQVLMTMGDFYFTRGDWGEALRRYAKVDERGLDDAMLADYRYRKAYSYLMLAEYDKAEPLLKQLEGSREYANAARFYQAYIAYTKGEYSRALQLFKNVDTAKEPGNTADYYLAQLYFHSGDYNQAFAAAKRIIATDPIPDFTTEARRIAGESLYNLGYTADAIPYLWQYLGEASEPQPSAYYILGKEEYNDRNYNNAAKLFQQAVSSNDAMAQNAYLYLGQCYLKTGNRDNALMAFENAYRMSYDRKVQETALYNYAVARSEGGKAPFSSSVAVFEDFLKQFPSSRYAPAISEYLVSGYMTDDDYENALASINRITNPSPEILAAKQRVLFVLGTRDYSSGNTALALNRFDQARAIAGADADIANQAMLWSGDCYYSDENWEKAAQCYTDYLDNAPLTAANRRLAYYDLGYTEYNRRNYDEALRYFGLACNTEGALSDVALADARDRMGDCYFARHEYDAAVTSYQKAYDTNPASGDYALYRLALVRGAQGSYQQEVSLLDNMMDRFPSSGLFPAALLAKAEAYTALGNSAKAVAAYNQLVRDYPSSSYGRNGQLQLAITYLNKGDRAHAIDAYRKVIYTYPTSEEARVASDDLKRLYAEDGKLSEYLAFMSSIPNAPEVDPSEVETLAYDVAEEWYFSDKGTAKLKSYLADYPNGNYKARALYYLAEDAEDKGLYDEAYRYATDVVVTYPDSEMAEEALAIKGSCELHQGKGEIALDTYRTLETKASTPAMLHDARMQIMRIARDLGRNGDVVTTAEKLLSTSAVGGNELDEIHFTHAFSLNALGRYDEAEKEWAELAKDPADLYGAKSSFYMAQSQYDRDLTDRAYNTVTRFLDADSPQAYWRARGVILLSDILRKKGSTFEADEYLRALKNNYNDPVTQMDITEMVDARLGRQE